MIACKTCGTWFRPDNSYRVNCSTACKATAQTKITQERLARFAFMGLPAVEIAEACGATPAGVARALKRYGLYEQWREQRFA